jgi:hypothetical protein
VLPGFTLEEHAVIEKALVGKEKAPLKLVQGAPTG